MYLRVGSLVRTALHAPRPARFDEVVPDEDYLHVPNPAMPSGAALVAVVDGEFVVDSIVEDDEGYVFDS